MKPIRATLAALAALAAVVVSSISVQAELLRYQATPASKVKVDGTSTVHDWTMEGKIIGGSFEIDSTYSLDQSQGKLGELKSPTKAEANIPVQSIKSGKKRMDEVMLEAMKQPEFPKISYKLSQLSPKSGDRKPGTPLEFESKGELTIAGVTKTVDMPVTIEKVEGSKLRIIAAAPIKMTQYGIKPPAPTIALGLIKVGDDIKVSLEWILAQKTDAAK